MAAISSKQAFIHNSRHKIYLVTKNKNKDMNLQGKNNKNKEGNQ